MSQITGNLAENILALSCFNTQAVSLLRSNVSPDLLGMPEYREIYKRVLNYYATFSEAPGEHLADICEDLLTKEETGLYVKILENIYGIKEGLNKDYIFSKLEEFISTQSLKLAITQAAGLLKDGKTEDAWNIFSMSRNKQLKAFEKGMHLSDVDTIFEHLDSEEDIIYTGIAELDKYKICPTAKRLMLLLGRSGEGKTWFLIQCAKSALTQGKKVLHLTLEMPEKDIGLRYLQAIYSVPTHEAKICLPMFKRYDDGLLKTVEYEERTDMSTLKDKTVRNHIKNTLKEAHAKNLLIKEFPESSLSYSALEAYLENLESFYNFIPNLILIDYPDLMFIDPQNVRIETGILYKQLHGLAKKKNIALVGVTQPNRLAEDVPLITRKHLSEDITKVHIADFFLTFNRTLAERSKGLARLFVDKSRTSNPGKLILITQNYNIGQFCLDSMPMQKEYSDILGLS